MSYQPFYIADLKSGLVRNPEAFLAPKDAFPSLENAYIWRGRILRKDGYEFLDRLCRDLTAIVLNDTTANGAQTTIPDVLADSSIDVRAPVPPVTPEPNAALKPGSVTIVVDPGGGSQTTFVEPAPPDGSLILSAGPLTISTASINYATGEIIFNWAPAIVGPFNIAVTLKYCPALPVMGLRTYEIPGTNQEDLIAFDTKYSYIYDAVGKEFDQLGAPTTWVGDDFQFFWTTNYWQDASNNGLFWETNFNAGNGAGNNDPIRYTNGTTWTDFAPAISSVFAANESLGTVTTPWTTFGPVFLANLPVIPTSVEIEVNATAPDVDVFFRDDGNGLLVTSPPSLNTGTINYTTGQIDFTLNPALTIDAPVTASYRYADEFLHQCLAILPFKDRLLVFNTWEGTTLDSAVQFPQRVRFSQNGDPTDIEKGWVSDVPGRGGFIDAPTNEHMTTVAFIRDILVVGFERSTWQLRYTGNEILPFVWEKINTELGCESPFSLIQFDKGVLAIGEESLHSCNGNSVDRIDLQIPDEVLQIHNLDEGAERVYGIRDLRLQNVYWTIPSSALNRKFPNTMLVYNYLNKSFSIWRDHYTCFGRWQNDLTIRWQDLDDEEVHLWRTYKFPWNWAGNQAFYPRVVGGNQQGFVEILNQSSSNDDSLQITAISNTSPVRITSPDHNLETNDFVVPRAIIDPASFATALIGNTYKIIRIDENNFDLTEYNSTSNSYTAVTLGGTNEYAGGGSIILLSNFEIASKRFNIYGEGVKTKLGHIDFFTDTTEAGEFTCQIFINENDSEAINTGFVDLPADPSNFFNSIVSTTRSLSEYPNSSKNWHRFYCNTSGQSYQYVLKLNDAQMNDQDVQESPLTVHALILWNTTDGRLI